MRVMGVDPSLSNTGYVRAEINEDGTLTPYMIGLIQTTPSDSVRYKNEDDYRRAGLIHAELRDEIEWWEPEFVFVEMPVGSQSARACVSYGICIGVFSGLDATQIIVRNSDVKEIATGNKKADKKDMIAWATSKYPDLNWFKGRLAGGYGGKNEHPADALGALEVGLHLINQGKL